MKSFLFLALIAFMVLLVLAQAFRANFEAELQQKVDISIAKSRLVAPPPPKQPTASSSLQYFHGPVGPPHIVGPSGPPPNY